MRSRALGAVMAGTSGTRKRRGVAAPRALGQSSRGWPRGQTVDAAPKLMPHKYLPRVGAGVLALVTAACADPAAPGTGLGPGGAASLQLLASPPDSTLPVRLVEFTVRVAFARRPAALRVVVDAGQPGERVIRDYARTDVYAPPRLASGDMLSVWAPIPGGDGRHTVTLVAEDSSGRSERVSFARTFGIPEAAYTATVLAAGGGDAEALGLNDQGDAAGWVAAAGGHRRPAVWRAGRLDLLPTSDTVDVVATRINAAGDVLGGASVVAGARVWRADGRVLALGAGPVVISPTYSVACCSQVNDLTDGRVALGGGPGVVALDVASGTARTLSTVPSVLAGGLNDRGQALAYYLPDPVFGYSWFSVGTPLAVPALADRYCEASISSHNPSYLTPARLGADGEVLARAGCGGLSYAPAGGAFQSLAPLVGRGAAGVMSARGGLVAARDPADSALYVWRAGDPAARRLRVAGLADWRVSAVNAVNPAGVIAVRATHVATGRSGAVLLAPAR